MKRVAIYARYSSSKQREQSIEGQLRVCRAFCTAKDWDVVQVYVDRARSGRNDNRPEFQRMLQDAPKQFFDIVLVYQLDRFARNTYDSRKNEDYLSKYGIRVLSATEPVTSEDDEAHEDSFLARGIVELFAENFSRDLSRKVKRGMRETYYKRKVSGKPPYGYKVENGQIVIDEEQAKNVRTIFNLRASGVTVPEIKAQMENIIPKNNICYIIKNKKYTGSFVNPFDPEDVIDDMYPPLISEEVYFKANSIKGSKHTKHISSSDEPLYALTGKLYDEITGLPYKGHSGKTKSKHGPYRYYVCKAEKTVTLKKDEIEDAVYLKLIDVLTDEENLNLIAKQLIQFKSKSSDSKEIQSLQKQLLKNQNDQNKLATAFMNANPDMFELLNKKASALKEEEKFLDHKIKELQANSAFSSYDEESIKRDLKNALLFKQSDSRFKYKALSLLINTVFYNKDAAKLSIYISLKHEDQITLQEHKINLDKVKANPQARVRLTAKLVNRTGYSANFLLCRNEICGFFFAV